MGRGGPSRFLGPCGRTRRSAIGYLDAAENQRQTEARQWRRESQTRRAEAGGSLSIDAGGDLTLASAANVRHHESHTATTDWTSRRVRQQGSDLAAGDDLTLRSGRDLRLVASEAEAGEDATLVAGRDAELLAANDRDYSLYEKEESGLFSSSYRRDEIDDRRAVGSRLESGGDLTVASGVDQRYQSARLEAGDDLTLSSGGAIHFEAARDLHREVHEASSSNFAWQSSEGEGATDETLRQSRLIARGERLIQAADGIRIDVEDIDRQAVSRTIDAMVEADPELAWLQDMEERGDVDWRRVKAIHDRWEYEHSGLSGPAQLVVAIAVAYFTAGAASTLVASGASAAGASTAAGGAWAAASDGAGDAQAQVTPLVRRAQRDRPAAERCRGPARPREARKFA